MPPVWSHPRGHARPAISFMYVRRINSHSRWPLLSSATMLNFQFNCSCSRSLFKTWNQAKNANKKNWNVQFPGFFRLFQFHFATAAAAASRSSNISRDKNFNSTFCSGAQKIKTQTIKMRGKRNLKVEKKLWTIMCWMCVDRTRIRNTFGSLVVLFLTIDSKRFILFFAVTRMVWWRWWWTRRVVLVGNWNGCSGEWNARTYLIRPTILLLMLLFWFEFWCSFRRRKTNSHWM